MREETIKMVYATWEELSPKRKQEEIKKALESGVFWDNFSDIFYQEYELELKRLQEKHDLDLTPIYTNISQHHLLGFEFETINFIFYKDVSFYLERYNPTIQFSYEEDNTQENKQLKEELQNKVNAFIEDFHKIYDYYKDYFMYGNCSQYEEYVKETLEYNEHYEYLIEEKVVS